MNYKTINDCFFFKCIYVFQKKMLNVLMFTIFVTYYLSLILTVLFLHLVVLLKIMKFFCFLFFVFCFFKSISFV